MSVKNVILSHIVNTVDGTSVVHDVWQIECHADNMVMPCVQVILHRTPWECGRCATKCQYYDVRINLGMPPYISV